MGIAAFLCFALAAIMGVASPSLGLVYQGAAISGAIYASAAFIAGIMLTTATILRRSVEHGFRGLAAKTTADEPILELTQRAPVAQEPPSTPRANAWRAATGAADLAGVPRAVFDIERVQGAVRRFLFPRSLRERSAQR